MRRIAKAQFISSLMILHDAVFIRRFFVLGFLRDVLQERGSPCISDAEYQNILDIVELRNDASALEFDAIPPSGP